ncbi:hypothetical protein Sden_2845 [Shewanella denitrificans OS217]|uniref:DUF4440 domain-containing protein n=1 Tax=Shewanella denitrificans (strain OS217 / ATCC BAA-1090 / DSM 15013) TaxID=318161 RepID=Q12KA2_SHEDO|nr:nuclear transport factor 2 family protein [Shewanella denitrificans]ABE56124.1 hypothetical protein Sden_2845 [Shewanella denitrificans OS217]
MTQKTTMKHWRYLTLALSGMLLAPLTVLLPALVAASAPISAASTLVTVQQQQTPLFSEISTLDQGVFDAFNKCSDSAELKKHASYFDQDVEFYHDTGGVTWNRDDMIANTQKYACGNYRRELVPNSLKVVAVKEFGAIEQGVHRFCKLDSGDCEGMADFVIVWRQQDNKWLITRVLSYGHRTTEAPSQ